MTRLQLNTCRWLSDFSQFFREKKPPKTHGKNQILGIQSRKIFIIFINWFGRSVNEASFLRREGRLGQECQTSEFYPSTSRIPALTQLCRYENLKRCLCLLPVDSRREKENVANDYILIFSYIKVSGSSVFPSIIGC